MIYLILGDANQIISVSPEMPLCGKFVELQSEIRNVEHVWMTVNPEDVLKFTKRDYGEGYGYVYSLHALGKILKSRDLVLMTEIGRRLSKPIKGDKRPIQIKISMQCSEDNFQYKIVDFLDIEKGPSHEQLAPDRHPDQSRNDCAVGSGTKPDDVDAERVAGPSSGSQ